MHLNFGGAGGAGIYHVHDADGNALPIGYQYDTSKGGQRGFTLPGIEGVMTWDQLRSRWSTWRAAQVNGGTMKIGRIEIDNFLGIRHVHVDIERPVLVVGALNKAGKSSMRDAIRLALTGEPSRVSKKKDYAQLVRDGAKFAHVLLHTGERKVGVQISRGGNIAAEMPEAIKARARTLGLIMDAQRFADMSGDDRRRFLFSLMGVSITPEAIRERLRARKVDDAKVDEIMPVLRSGIEAGAKVAAQNATEARGAWRAVTGDTYGPKKADTWEAERGDWKPENAGELATLVESIDRDEAALAELNKRLGIAQHEHGKREERTKAIEHLRATAKLHAERSDVVKLAEDLLAQARESLAHAKAHRLHCPRCQAALLLALPEGGAPALTVAPADAEYPEVPPLEAEIEARSKALDDARARVKESDEAGFQLAALEQQQREAVAAGEAAEIEERIGAVRVTLDKARHKRDAFRGMLELFEGANKRTELAGKHHADALAWDAIAEALSPEPGGIPSEIMQDALSPFNERLRQSALDTDWGQVQVDADMEVRIDGRAFHLTSESEQWRANAHIAEAVAHIAGDRLMVLDRFDVLQDSAKAEALEWLDVLAREGEIDTAIILGTLRTLSKSLPSTIQTLWLEGGEPGEAPAVTIERTVQREAAAA